MMLTTNQTVENFFQQANWQGLKLIDSDLSSSEQDSSSTNSQLVSKVNFALTVEEYFTQNNWQGIRVNIQNNHQTKTETTTELVYSLKMSVEEFFQRMVWQGQPKVTVKPIATQPHHSNSKQTNDQTRSILNMQDLSDLI